MTISIDIGKFKTKIEHVDSFVCRNREIEFDVMWHSCGIYEMSYYRPRDAKPHYIMVDEDWHPPDTHITFTPEHFEKVAELYLSAPKRKRSECYKPFYEDYDQDRGMFDFENDTLFQAFKDPRVEKLYMVNHQFVHGSPHTNTSVLGLNWEDFKRLKDLLDSKKHEIFYSACKVDMLSNFANSNLL